MVRDVSYPDRFEESGPLSGHVREGRRFMPPLAATGVFHEADWTRDDLPDLIWPILALAKYGTSFARQFVGWQKAVIAELEGECDKAVLGIGLDGRLTSLELLVEECPRAKEVTLGKADEFGLLPDSIARVMAPFPERPASWLIDCEVDYPNQQDLQFLASAILEAVSDGHREAIVKCLRIWNSVLAGTFSADQTLVDLLKDYPTNVKRLSQADSVVRATWGSLKAADLTKDPSSSDASVRWAKVFWGVNSMTTRCLRRRELDDGAGERSDHSAEPSASPEHSEPFRNMAMDLFSSYVQSLETSPARLYDQERQEVHAGLVGRAAREVVTALGAPDLWCMEHGAHIGRTLVEVQIYLQWMASQDESIYRTYQEYGQGKAKLYARVLAEIPSDLWTPDMEAAVDELDRLSHNHDILDHRVVDTRDSFSGKSLRQMAEECGLLDMYRHAYYLASGVTHSEWWSIESHCMERCMNILHRGHLIPSLDLAAGENVDLARSWLEALYRLIRVSLSILGTDREAVDAAFDWMSPGTPDATPGTDEI